MATTSTSTTSAINFNIYNLSGITILTHRLIDYFEEGKTSTLNAYYSIYDHEIPFLIKMRKDYISVNGMICDENIMRINISGQKNMDRPEALKRMREFRELIGIAIEQYLIEYVEDGLCDGLFDE